MRLRDRVRTLPESLTESLEQLLDRIVASAIAEPYPVHTAEELRTHLERDGHPPLFGAALFFAVASRTRRSLRIGKRTIPLALAAKFGADLAGSFRLGAYELELLASLVVQRMRSLGVVVDSRVVQRVAVNAYLSPGRRHDVMRRRRSAPARLVALWSGRVMAVEPAVGRLRKAADLVETLDFTEPPVAVQDTFGSTSST